MALDAVSISLLSKEIDSLLQDSRIDKIHQPSKDEVVLNLRRKTGNIKLLISARSGSGRICVTKEDFENPQTPPSFCMLLRKYLGGARFVCSNFVAGERIIILTFLATSEMGDTVNVDVAVELMGRYANIVVINEKGKIIDAMKRVDADASSVRQLLPGLEYKLPPNRENPKFIEETGAMLDKLFKYEGLINQGIMKSCQGIGPVIAREIAYLSDVGQTYCDTFSSEQKERVVSATNSLVKYYHNPIFTTVFDETGKPSEFSFFPLEQYEGFTHQTYDSLNQLLEEYYSKKDKQERLKQKGKDLHKLVQNLIDRNLRKSAARLLEQQESLDNEKYKIYGELLTANLYKIEKGMKKVTVDNYYDDTEITIKLDAKLSPNQNAQKYYKEYKKRQTALVKLDELIKQGTIELEYLRTIEYAIHQAENEEELMNIRSELHQSGYLKSFKTKNKKQKAKDFIKYISSDGFLILVGRNNLQNDKLTMKTARGKDLWFHTKKAPGSHVVVMSEGNDIPLQTQNEAAMLAVHHSSLQGSSKVAVDYTFVKNIKKTNDLKPGMVIYDTNETAYVTPDIEVIGGLENVEK